MDRPYLSSSYISLALRLQESCPDLTSPDARAKLAAALMEVPLSEQGKRNNANDQQVIQTIHDHSVALGADCENEPDADDMKERYISQKDRDKMDPSDFAGEGTSFPIKTQEDVDAAARSLGMTDQSHSTVKANIIRIAKRKGLSIPKAWRESAVSEPAEGDLRLRESQAFSVDIPLSEAFATGNKIKLITPGKGSSAWYTEAALQKAAADKIFHAGLPMRIDHPTPADQAARPEGSVKDWGAVLAQDAVWLESYIGKDGKDHGKGLYSEIKPFSDHALTIQEKGPYAGVSIEANGHALIEAGKKVIRDGVPVLKEFTSADGADMVTRAGAGGLFLQESAALPQQQASMGPPAPTSINIPKEVSSVTQEEAQKLIEAAVSPFRARAVKADARDEASKLLERAALPEAAKQKIVEAALRSVPEKDGALDVEVFRESVVALVGIAAEAAGLGQVRGFGAPAPVVSVDPKEIAAREAQVKAETEDDLKVWESLMGNKQAAAFAARGRAS